MIAIITISALSVVVMSCWLTVGHWVRRHAEPKRPSLVVIEGGRGLRTDTGRRSDGLAPSGFAEPHGRTSLRA